MILIAYGFVVVLVLLMCYPRAIMLAFFLTLFFCVFGTAQNQTVMNALDLPPRAEAALIDFNNFLVDVTNVMIDLVNEIIRLFYTSYVSLFPIRFTDRGDAKNPVKEFMRDILEAEELPSEKIMREAREAQANEGARIRAEIEAYKHRLKDIKTEATKKAEKADVKAVREMMKPKMSEEDVGRIARQVAEQMKAQKAA